MLAGLSEKQQNGEKIDQILLKKMTDPVCFLSWPKLLFRYLK